MAYVYDPYSVESTVTAAVVNSAVTGQKAKPVTGKFRDFLDYTPVLVDRSSFTAEQQREFKPDFSMKGRPEDAVDDGLAPSILRDILNAGMASEYHQSNANLNRICNAMDFFKNRNLALLDQDTKKKTSKQIIEAKVAKMSEVWRLYNEAITCLTTGTRFVGGLSADVSGYLAMLSAIKTRISTFMNTVLMEIGDKTYEVPVMNVTTDQTVWARNFLEKRFSHGMLYEINGETIYVTAWSDQKKGKQAFFNKTIKTLMKENYTVVFTGQN